jgi:hypothetical protein
MQALEMTFVRYVARYKVMNYLTKKKKDEYIYLERKEYRNKRKQHKERLSDSDIEKYVLQN